jgi:hypothetical protein
VIRARRVTREAEPADGFAVGVERKTTADRHRAADTAPDHWVVERPELGPDQPNRLKAHTMRARRHWPGIDDRRRRGLTDAILAASSRFDREQPHDPFLGENNER